MDVPRGVGRGSNSGDGRQDRRRRPQRGSGGNVGDFGHGREGRGRRPFRGDVGDVAVVKVSMQNMPIWRMSVHGVTTNVVEAEEGSAEANAAMPAIGRVSGSLRRIFGN
ncbi:hypothetical protein GBAR_LOCUS12795 [Geodia barretti]|uniref:Uncharacterized protein n=1 Tax=Geodia barretti TaxID=519541 RepID=A0AA35WP69_GEOBA|nr:hypothetical protein GBAR_LOCUS12795 [Geodia barretti]